MSSIKFLLTKLNCDACAKVSRIKISKIEGVTKVEINSRGNEADGILEANRDITIPEIQQSLVGTPYEVHAV
jgi:hypothetical protein